MSKVIFDPYRQIVTMREMLLFGIRLCDMVEKGEVDKSLFNNVVTIDNLKITPAWESHNISNLTKNLRLCVLGTSYLVIDEALDCVYGGKPDVYSDSDVDALRAIIFMLRCAIAHGVMIPRWKAKGIYCRKFRINEIDYEIDMTQLDGKVLKHRDYGALGGIVKLIEYTLQLLKRHGYGNQP